MGEAFSAVLVVEGSGIPVAAAVVDREIAAATDTAAVLVVVAFSEVEFFFAFTTPSRFWLASLDFVGGPVGLSVELVGVSVSFSGASSASGASGGVGGGVGGILGLASRRTFSVM